MSGSKELVTTGGLTEEALVAAATQDMVQAGEILTVPRLKIAQSLTTEVTEGNARPGELLHSLTGESYGTAVEFVVVDSFKGRSWKDPKTGDFHSVGRGEVRVPWEDHPCYGQHFVDCPDAEEQFRAAVRANERDWGSGPGIATTYNFVVLLVTEEDGIANFPVRITLSKSSAKEGRNLGTMLNIARAPWDVVYEISTSQTRNKRGEPFTAVRVGQSRKTTDEERAAAVGVAQLIHSGDTEVAFDEVVEEDDRPVTAEPVKGGLDL